MTDIQDVPVDWRIIYHVRVISVDNFVFNLSWFITDSIVKEELYSRGI